MISIARCFAALLIAVGMLISGAWERTGETEVDLALVLAVDVSLSMEPDEQDLQRQGFIEAFRSPEVHDAIRKGMLGRIAVVYVEWAGAAYQEVIVPWTVIEQPGRCARLCGPPGAKPDPSHRLHIDLGSHRLQPVETSDERRPGRSTGHRHLRRRSQQPGPDGNPGP